MLKNRILLLAILFIALSSCKKVLDVEPEFNLDGTKRFNSIADYEYSLVGTYSIFQSTSYYGGIDGRSNAFVTLPDVLSDNVFESSESLGNERVFSRWSYAEDEDQINRTWLAAYRVIAQANVTLQGLDRFAGSNAGAVNRIKGQARAIRGLVHFDILRYWADNYDRNSTMPGIPFVGQFNYELKPTRGTVKQTYDSIEYDLKSALTLLANTDRAINTSGSRAYIDTRAVNAMLARMYLYSNQWDSAIKYATQVINVLPLADQNEFPKIWVDASVSEVAWSVTFEAGQGQPGYHFYYPPSDVASYLPAAALLASYSNADVRYDAYFQSLGGRLLVSKYLAKEAQLINPDGVVNFKAFRTGEMYLIRAEAYARSGNEPLALVDLNTLRAARIAGFTAGTETGAALTNAIALERRKELIGEGHRFFDLKRTTRMVNRTNCTSFCTLGAGNRAWTWPIPQPEIDANPSILPQNTGY